METKRIETKSSTLVKGAANQDPMTDVAYAPTAGTRETTGRSKGEAIGGAVGQTIGAGVDVAVGAVKGGIAAGKNVIDKMATEPVNPSAEHEFWRKEYANRPYFTIGTPYDQYGPAFQYGWASFANHKGKTFEDVESQLARDWEDHRGTSKLSWNHAKGATHDAWQRAEKAVSGDSCGAN